MFHLFNPHTKVPVLVKEIVWIVLGTIALAISIPAPIWS